ncbi:hypothetical protein BJ085DRAFT_29392 [Dimargaris cristalligena]|uniref:RGS domain-containing protein n=1 Tax=Dimargaris cristalligena TaxID=215637 RepID=A0A4P9ZP50_9FUNG|nr:hypothetical protein BJ085DRAFT_29392 [Dimargaris cristalligena]|eukprot:RKP34985.1 hypothetical protein BJ085DRAFT_29392 [Dimargaris cristalligena]
MAFNPNNYLGTEAFADFDLAKLESIFATKTKIIAPFIAIVTAMFLVSTVLFLIKSRTSRELQRRSVGLTLAGSVLGYFVFIVFALRSIVDITCSAIIWPTYLGLLQVNLVVFLKALRLWVMNYSNRAKVIRLESPEQPETFWERHRTFFKYDTLDRRMLLALLVISVPLACFLTVIAVRSDDYAMGRNTIWCSIGWEIIPVTILVGLVCLVVFPITMFKIRRIRDAYLIRNDLLVACLSSAILVPSFYIMESAIEKDKEIYFNSTLFLSINMVILQVSAVVVPLIQFRNVPGDHPAQQGLSIRQTFIQIAEDPQWMAQLCKFCELNFCSELALFLNEYRKLKFLIWESKVTDIKMEIPSQKSSMEIINSLDSLPPPFDLTSSDPLHSDLLHLPNQSSSETFTLPLAPIDEDAVPSYAPASSSKLVDLLLKKPTKTLPATTYNDFSITTSILDELPHQRDRPVKSTLRHHYFLFYQRFCAPDAMWEVNLSGRTLRTITDQIERNAPTLAMFDTAKDEVCQLLMQDILPKFIMAHFHQARDFK